MVAESEDVRRGERLLLRQHAGLATGTRRWPRTESCRSGRRASSLRSRGCRRAPPYCEIITLRVAVGAVRQRQHVTGIDEVRVLDLRIDLPDLGPEPRILEEHRGDVPERVAALHGVVHGRVGADELRRGRSRSATGASFSAATAASVAVRSSAVLSTSARRDGGAEGERLACTGGGGANRSRRPAGRLRQRP